MINVACCFLVFSLAGWVIETFHRSICHRRLINPGFLMGPYLPIWGFGGLAVIAGHAFLDSYALPVRALIYFFALGALEFITGYAIMRVLGIRLWDYRDRLLNIKGHVCLRFTLYFTLMAASLDLFLDPLALHLLPGLKQFGPTFEYAIGVLLTVVAVEFIFRISRTRAREELLRDGRERLKLEFVSLARPLLENPGVAPLGEINHHYGKSRLNHVLDVAWVAFRLGKLFSLDDKAIVRGALLHDLFYYDWLREGPKWHGVKHPGIALKNAQKIVDLSLKEQDIIKKHMWPLTVVPPRYAESWVVCLSDMSCSWRDYLAPLLFSLVGKRQQWKQRSIASFPSLEVIVENYPKGGVALQSSSARRLRILLVDAQPRSLPMTTFRTLTLARVAGATPDHHEVSIVDGRVEDIEIPSHGIDVVGITFSCNNSELAYKIAAEAKAKGAIAVAGGPHATAVPDEVLEHFDSVVTGEAEGGVWEDFLGDAQSGSPEKLYRQQTPPELDALRPPRLDLLHSNLYLPVYPVEATRGCPNQCSFCFNRYIHPTFRTRPVEHIVADIERSDRKRIFFMDDNLVADREFAKELFRSLRGQKKQLFFQMQLDAAKDEELVRLAAEAGCKGIFTGLESVNTASLESVSKPFNQLERYKELVSILERHGIFVTGGIIFGLDGDSKEIFRQTEKLLSESGIFGLAANLVIPYPGTQFHSQMQDDRRILSSDYEEYNGYNLIVAPERMTVEQLRDGYKTFVSEYYSTRQMLSRFRRQKRPLAQFPTYAATNLAFGLARKRRSRAVGVLPRTWSSAQTLEKAQGAFRTVRARWSQGS